jgi:hypothetical protein
MVLTLLVAPPPNNAIFITFLTEILNSNYGNFQIQILDTFKFKF